VRAMPTNSGHASIIFQGCSTLPVGVRVATPNPYRTRPEERIIMSRTSTNSRDARTEPALLRRRDVEAKTGLSRTTMHRLMVSGAFPRPVVIAKRAVAWHSRDVDAWIASLCSRPEVRS
jgi:prophage regulatory protein